jgi:hypothetical protein
MNIKHTIAALSLLGTTIMAQAAAAADTPSYFVPKDSPAASVPSGIIQEAKALAAQVGGRATRIADTGSMIPTLTSHDIIIYRPAIRVSDLSKGDIVLVAAQLDGNDPQNPVSLFAHRVLHVDLAVGKFRTQGDHNKEVDPFTGDDSNIRGLVIYIIDGKTGEIHVPGKSLNDRGPVVVLN